MHYADVCVYFLEYILPILSDCYKTNPETYEPTGREVVKIAGKNYYLPNSIKVNGQIILQHNGSAKRFIEGSNLMRNWAKTKNFEDMPLFLAAYLQEKPGERYNERAVIERAEVMKRATMDVVWDVFFCISQLTDKFESASLLFIQAEAESQAKILDRRLRRGYLQLRAKEFITGFWRRKRQPYGN